MKKLFQTKFIDTKGKISRKDGGKDFQDEFVIDRSKSGYIDYLAYSYLTDGGAQDFVAKCKRKMDLFSKTTQTLSQ